MISLSIRPAFTALVGVLVLTAGPLALAPQASTRIEFQVLAPGGAPVRDLKPGEVAIRLGGRERAIQSLELVERDAAGPGGGAPPLAPPFGTNAGPAGAGHTTLLAIEDETVAPGMERPIRELGERLVAALRPGDRIGIIVLPRPVVRLAPTGDAAQIREALSKINGRRPVRSTTSEDLCRTRETLETLRGAIESLVPFDGGKTILVMSSRLNPPGRVSGATCEITPEHVEAIAAATTAVSGATYVIHVDDQVSGRNDGLEGLASATSGAGVLRLTRDESPLDRIRTETSAHYVATVEGETGERGSDQGHRLEVRVSRPGVETRVPVLYRPRPAAGRPAAGRPAAGATTSPRDMVRSPEAFRALPMRVVAYASRSTADKVRVLVLAEPDGAATLKAASAGLVDSGGRIQQVAIDEKQLTAMPLMTAFEAAPGRYRVRVAATDADGRAGAADYEVDAQLTDAGALKLSGLVLGTLRNNAFAPALQFGAGDASAVAYFEAYGQISGNVSASVEIARTVDGPALVTVQPGGQRSNEADKVLLTAQLPLDKLEPGDYVVRATLKMGDGPEGRLLRTLRKQ